LHDRATPTIPSAVLCCRDARQICLREYGDAPDVKIFGAKGLAFPYIPSHLHHIMFELTKNSLRAVADRYEAEDVEPPPIRVVISQGDEDITIKARAIRFCSLVLLLLQVLHLDADRYEAEDIEPPPIRVAISQGDESITIKARCATRMLAFVQRLLLSASAGGWQRSLW
jgi:hypothetical protein